MIPPGSIAIIPARMGSTRFPGKPLANKTGKTLIQHVVEAAERAGSVSRVVIATDDERIRVAVEAFGGEAVMTGEHENGTSRLAEAAGLLGLGPDEIVINVQGDEPEIEPSVIDAAVGALVDSGCPIATVASPLPTTGDATDPNVVKVVLRSDGRAMYFTRAGVPYARTDDLPAARLRHVGLYVYRRAFLDVYAGLGSTPLERTERLEQLRVLEHGHDIAVAVVESRHEGIDTPEQYEAFVERQRSAMSD